MADKTQPQREQDPREEIKQEPLTEEYKEETKKHLDQSFEKDIAKTEPSSKRKKKPKVVYIDDGRTIADMSNVGYGTPKAPRATGSTARDKWRTYWEAVRMMLVPMLVTLGIITVAYLLLFLSLK